MKYNILFNILKYIVLTLSIYSVLKYVLDYNMTNFDTIITTTILVLLIILAEVLYKMCTSEDFKSFKSMNPKNYCNSYCNRIENMSDIANNNDTTKNNTTQNNTTQNNMSNKPMEENAKPVEQPPKPIEENTKPMEENAKPMEESNKPVEETTISMDSNSMDSNSMDSNSMDSKDTNSTEDSNKPVEEKKNTPIISKTGNNTYQSKVEKEGDRYNDGVINNEYEYSDYNMLPMAENNSGNFEYGYSFMPPEKWYPQPPHPPVCVTNKRSDVMPVYTTGTPIDVKEWNESRRITPPDTIKTQYIKQKLNSGR